MGLIINITELHYILEFMEGGFVQIITHIESRYAGLRAYQHTLSRILIQDVFIMKAAELKCVNVKVCGMCSLKKWRRGGYWSGM